MRLDEPPVGVGQNRTWIVGLALALAVVATLAGAMASVAGALTIDDTSPCPAAYTEPVGEEPGPQPPFVCPGGVVGTPYAVQLIGRGSCEPYFKFTVVNGALPPGLSISSKGLISGTPTTAGQWSARIRAQDLRASDGGPDWCTSSDEAEGMFTIAVSEGLVVTTESAAPGTIGVFYHQPLSAQLMSGPGRLSPPSDCAANTPIPGFCPLTWWVAQGRLPERFTLNPVSGLIWGIPVTEGSASFVVRAALDDGRTATRSFTITIRRPVSIRTPKPFASSGARTLWEIGVPFSAKLAASGGTDTYSWSLTEGRLPTGLALTADGTIAGTPRANGPFRATIHVADAEGRTADYQAVFRVASRLAITAGGLRPGKVGLPYRGRLATRGGIGAKRWKVERGLLPPGLRFDRARGTVRGTPTRQGRYRVAFLVTDALGATSTRTLVIDVLA